MHRKQKGGLPARKNNRFRKKDDSENMDIPVMPHPGTDTQASPYQSRQTKEPVPIVRRSLYSLNAFLGLTPEKRYARKSM